MISEDFETPDPELKVALPRRRFEDNTEMDITPMIDCTFLLLIFFIVCSRTDVQTAIQLARAHHGVAVSAKGATVITIAESGRSTAPVYLADGKIADQQLPEDIEAQSQQIQQAVQDAVNNGKTDVLIKAEKGVAHRDVSRVTAAVSRVSGIRIFYGVADAE